MIINGKKLFKRKWKVTITEPKTGKSKVYQSTNSEGLRIQFDIHEGSNTNHSQECNITLTNLNPENRKWVSQKNNIVKIEAGYEELFGEIFTGKVILGDNLHDNKPRGFSNDEPNRRNDTDWSTEIKCIDSSIAKNKSVISLSFSEKTTLQTVVNKLCDELGLKNHIKLPKGQGKEKFNNGYSAYGDTYQIIKDLARTKNLEWNVKGKALYMYDPKVGVNSEVYVINAGSGLIGSVDTTEEGYKFKTLLLPSLYKGQYINLKSQNVNGFFIISKLGYQGDTFNDEWYVEFEVINKK